MSADLTRNVEGELTSLCCSYIEVGILVNRVLVVYSTFDGVVEIGRLACKTSDPVDALSSKVRRLSRQIDAMLGYTFDSMESLTAEALTRALSRQTDEVYLGI
jgi:hypothetical protein